MNRYVWLVWSILLIPTLAAGPVFGQAPGPKKFGVLVGVNAYKHERLPNLRFAERDVQELAKVLELSGYQVTLLTGSNNDAAKRADKLNIEKQIKDVLRKCDRGDIIVLAFAGHGLQFENKPDAYFCPLDARPFKDETDTLVSLSSIYDDLNKSFAGMKVLFVDACRNDPDQNRGARSGIDADTAPRPPAGVAALFSCRAGERAFETDKLRHGIFFHHVLEGLKGQAANRKGEVTFAALAAHVSQNVSTDVPAIIGSGARQSPNLKADYSVEPVICTVSDGPGLALLKQFEGDWEMTMKMEGVEVKGVASFIMDATTSKLNGVFDATHRYGKISGRTIESYDPVRMTFVNITTDSSYDGASLFEGKYDVANKTLTMTGDLPGADGKSIRARSLTTFAGKDQFVTQNYLGDSKDAALSMTYKRIRPEQVLWKRLEGNWDVTIKTNGQEYPGKAIYNIDPNGKVLQSKQESKIGTINVSGSGTDTYDPVKKKYKSVWTDDISKTPTVSEGTFNTMTKTLTFEGTGTDTDGKMYKFLDIMQFIDADQIEARHYHNGEKDPSVILVYKRGKR